MWGKRIIISKHALLRYKQRNMTIKYNRSIESQIKDDLRPLMIRFKERLDKDTIKITTVRGRIYILKELERTIIVKTIYGIDLRDITIPVNRFQGGVYEV